MRELHIRPMNAEDRTEWQRMRLALWPNHSLQELQAEMAEISADLMLPVFVIARPDGTLGGFVETALRPWASGCATRPVGYIEAWYVDLDLRRQGWGGWLVHAAEAWAAEQGCQEMASDCELDNSISYQAHLALGYEETLRIIEFRKSIGLKRA
jgi:aminoglycoside 6'-N-acetyltransferase I